MSTLRKGSHCSVPMADTHITSSLSSVQAAHVTAADIPPELFRNIVRHVTDFDADERLPCTTGTSIALGEQLNCSLVCVYWAQEVRRSLYDKRRVWICTERQAKGFRKLVVHRSSKRLTPILDMIAHIDVYHTTDSRSWQHILLCLIPAISPHKFRQLRISGPSSPRSLHWGVPKCLTSFTTPYRALELSCATIARTTVWFDLPLKGVAV